MTRELRQAVVGIGAVAAVTHAYVRWLNRANTTTIALTLLLVVLLVAASSKPWVAIMTSIAAMLCFNFFFLPPIGTFAVADPENWVALAVFLGVSLVASQLSIARRSERLKSALLASIGHDLRTPLTTMRVAATNLQAISLSEEERREQAALVLAEVEQLTRLFQNILEMARIDAGAIATDRQWVDPAEVIQAARNQIERAFGAHRLDIQVISNRLVKVDPRLTAAALSQLLENAVQYTPDDTPIVVSVSTRADELVIAVRDRGPGIAAADLPRLFERFYRGADAKSRSTGTGMGLSIARGLLAAEGGRVWAANCVDGGAEFTIVVPAEVRRVDAIEVLA